MSVKTLRQFIFKRAKGCCEYCKMQAKYSPDSFCLEHIIPKNKNGETTESNLALSCSGCNGHKYNKTEGYDKISGKNVPLFHPRKQDWNSHFAWNEDFTEIIGITSTGRATAETLDMNRESLINIRKVLVTLNEHPPV